MRQIVTFKQKGDLSKTYTFLERSKNELKYLGLSKYGERGVQALASATPVRSGKTAASWSYEITRDNDRVTITWNNDNINNGVNIAVILQYGHASRGGSWVKGVDYINPTIRPIFDEIANDMWKEVTRH